MVSPKTFQVLAFAAALAFSTSARAEPRTIVVYFTEWSAQIDQPGTELIRQAAELSMRGGEGAVVVTGFADTTGSPEAATLMSATRMQVVVDLLVKDGISIARIHKMANGATDYVQSASESHRVTISVPEA